MTDQEVEMVHFKNCNIVSDERLIKLIKEIPPDIFLVSSDGQTYPCHYMVLAMFSQYFRKYFNQVPFQHGMKIPMEGISSKILDAVLLLFYLLETDMPRSLVPEFRSAMQLLEVDNFAYECDTVLMKAINDAMMVPSTKPKCKLFWYDFDKDEAYEDFPQIGLELHKNHKQLYWRCNGPDCDMRCVTKMIDGKVMIYKIGKKHSNLCEENDDDDIGHYFSKEAIEAIKSTENLKAKCAELDLNCESNGCDGTFKAKFMGGKLMGRRSTKHTPECEFKAQKVGEHSNAKTEQSQSNRMDDEGAIDDATAIGPGGGDVVKSEKNDSNQCIIV